MSNFMHPFSGYFIFLSPWPWAIICFPGMIIHVHRDVKYAHFGLDFYPSDANHRVGLFAKLLRNLEKPPVHSSYAFFDGCGTTPFYEAVLQGKEVCMSSLLEPSYFAFGTHPLISNQYLNMDFFLWKSNFMLIIALLEQHYNNPNHTRQLWPHFGPMPMQAVSFGLGWVWPYNLIHISL